MDQIKIGRFLKQLRNEKKLTQEQIAEQLNVSGRSVSRWETGNNMPDIGMLVELADFFNVGIAEIIDGERKSEKMHQEEKETLLKVADYSEMERNALTKNVLITSVIGLTALLTALIFDTFALADINALLMCIEGICFGLTIGALITCIFFMTGVLSKIRNNRKAVKIAHVLRIICLIMLSVCIIACIINTMQH